MNNLFDWEYNQSTFLQKDEKCFPKTDHATVHAYERLIEDPFNPNDCRSKINDKEERMIHVENEDRYLNLHDNDAKDLEFLEDDEQVGVKIYENTPNKQENLNLVNKKQEIHQDPKLDAATVQHQIQTSKDGQIQGQKSADYKLSKKWKKKINKVLEQKNIHQFSAKHNRNMAKFFVRLFSKYLKLSPQKQKLSPQAKQKLQEILDKSSVSLEDLENLFGCESSGPSREFLYKILRTKLKQEVLKSQDVQNKGAYLLCSKVYALRCRSRHLIGRLQSR